VTNNVTISWPSVPGAINYTIERSDNLTTGFSSIGNTTGNIWTDSPGIGLWCYRVIANGNCSEAEPSPAACVNVEEC
jgi:hypothetical protein